MLQNMGRKIDLVARQLEMEGWTQAADRWQHTNGNHKSETKTNPTLSYYSGRVISPSLGEDQTNWRRWSFREGALAVVWNNCRPGGESLARISPLLGPVPSCPRFLGSAPRSLRERSQPWGAFRKQLAVLFAATEQDDGPHRK
jgi:hypothetical protein